MTKIGMKIKQVFVDCGVSLIALIICLLLVIGIIVDIPSEIAENNTEIHTVEMVNQK